MRAVLKPAYFPPESLVDYELVDSGGGEKLERFGSRTLRRPDPQALWRPRWSGSDSAWERADFVFVRESDRGGRWESGPEHSAPRRSRTRAAEAREMLERGWPIQVGEARLCIRPTAFKHVGIFPEQATNWKLVGALRPRLGAKPRLLNLFGYTGVASVLAAQAGFEVTHVDASRTALAWARENAAASGLGNDGLRLILDDALGFARREARRGRHYEVILLDPPHYGRGPKSERWRFEDGLYPLLDATRQLAAERALVILSSYAIGYSPLAFNNLLEEFEGGQVSAGELVLEESAAAPSPPRLLSCGFCARWARGVELDSTPEPGAR